MLIDIIQWTCWIFMIVALGGVGIYLIFEPFWRRKGPLRNPVVTIKGDSNKLQDGLSKSQAAIEKLIDETQWHKRSFTITLTQKEILDAVGPNDIQNLIHHKLLEQFSELQDAGYMLGASTWYWNEAADPENGDRVVRVDVNVIKAEHARES